MHEYDDDDRSDFADPGGRSALRAFHRERTESRMAAANNISSPVSTSAILRWARVNAEARFRSWSDPAR